MNFHCHITSFDQLRYLDSVSLCTHCRRFIFRWKFFLLKFFLGEAKNEALENPAGRFKSSTERSHIIYFGHPHGIEYSTKTIHTVLLDVRPNVFAAVQFRNADFGRGNAQPRTIPHRNRLCFSLLLSFAEAKESRIGCTSKERRGCLAKKRNTAPQQNTTFKNLCLFTAEADHQKTN